MKRLLIFSWPLVVSHSVHAVNLFADRAMLSRYSKEAFAASLQGGILAWTIVTLFLATVMYAQTFIAHHVGAKEDRNVGPVLWQGIYIALISSVILLLIAPLGFPFFQLVGHEGNLPFLEGLYFAILTAGATTLLLQHALSCFFAGRGLTKIVLVVNLWIAGINILLNYLFIFGRVPGVPSGIAGAALATVTSNFFGIAAYAWLIAKDPTHETRFAVFSGWRFAADRFRRLLRFGFPSGVHQMIDMTGFTVFMLVVGAFGLQAQVASNMAMNINLLLFIPAVGIHIAVGILVGQFCGAKEHYKAERITATASVVCLLYMASVCFIYVFFPQMLLEAFRMEIPPEEWAAVFDLARILLLFVAFYSMFDAVFLVYSGSLKGAGDTKFVMWMSLIFATLFLTIPSVIIGMNTHWFPDPRTGLYVAWGLCSLYIVILAAVNLFRFYAGRWHHIEVIESVDTSVMEAPELAEERQTEAPAGGV